MRWRKKMSNLNPYYTRNHNKTDMMNKTQPNQFIELYQNDMIAVQGDSVAYQSPPTNTNHFNNEVSNLHSFSRDDSTDMKYGNTQYKSDEKDLTSNEVAC